MDKIKFGFSILMLSIRVQMTTAGGDFSVRQLSGTLGHLRAIHEPGNLVRVRRQTVKDPRLVYITFINKSGRKVRVLQSDFFGFAWPKFELRPNEPVTYFQYPGSTWIVQDSETGRDFLLNGKRAFLADWKLRGKAVDVRIKAPENFARVYGSPPTRPESTPLYLELMVIADSTLVQHYGKDRVEEYVLALFGIVAKVFKDASLGIPINIVVSDIYLSEKDPGFYKLKENNAEVSARSACRFVQSVRFQRGLNVDIGIVLTRKYIGPSGYAAMYTMCTSRSCALARENGFSSAYVIAHEIGHALGLEHDGEGDECVGDKTEGSIMAPKVYSKHDKYHWSKCSQQALSENIRYFRCLENKPIQVHSSFKRVTSNLPGVLFPPAEQCKIYHGKNAMACSKFAYRVCNYLWCRKHPWDECTPMFWTAPVDGSPCFGDRWCVRGRCVGRTKPAPVDGNWGAWSRYGTCRGFCNIGIRSRVRQCNNPSPQHQGKKCLGKAEEYQTCSLKPCPVKNDIQELRDVVCKEQGRDWRSIDFRRLNALMEKKGVRCSFEDGFCGWRGEPNAKMTWSRNRGETSSAGTGPNSDHTRNNKDGYYLYVEASWIFTYNPYKKGDKASLISPEINFGLACFSFYYHMYGDADCELRLYVRAGDKEREVWKQVGNQGNEWKRGSVQIQNKGPYQLKFVTVRGGSYKSDIAIDDVDIAYGSCTGVTTACSVICYSEQSQEIIARGAPDGLPCHNNKSMDICYQNECRRVGCDRKLDSSKVLDACGICGGNGKTCSLYTGSKTVKVTEGKQNILDIPRGTRDVLIRRRSSPETFLGLSALKTPHSGGFNHDKDRWPPGDYVIQGNNFEYVRNQTLEEIRSRGPLTNDIIIVLFSPKRKDEPRIPLEDTIIFQMRLARQPRNEYSWVQNGWNACSNTCSEDRQSPIYQCVERTGKTVLDIFCEHLEKPTDSKPCVSEECNARYIWLALNWTQCSATCGHGYQARRVMCLRRGRSFVNPSYCQSEAPSRVRQCYAGPCPSYTLMPGPWDACSKQCNGGTQSRRIYCVNLRDSKVIDSLLLCGGEYPVSIRPCNLAECDWNKKKELS